MTTHTTTSRSLVQPEWLRYVLRGNAVTSALSGFVMVVEAGPLAALLGITSPAILTIIGLVSVGYAIFLLMIAARTPMSREAVMLTVIADSVWVIGSILLLLTKVFPLTTEGKWIVLIQADVVGVFAVLQFLGMRRLNRE